MITATIIFVIAAALILGSVWFALRWAGRIADDDYMNRVLDDAEWAVKAERPAIEAEAVTLASAGWDDMPDLADHVEAARRDIEKYDLEQEILRDLDDCIAMVGRL